MAILTSNARRIRRKVLSRQAFLLIVFLASFFILLYHLFHHRFRHDNIPNEFVPPPQFIASINDPEINWTKFAYVQHVISPEDLCKAVMLFSQLKEASSLASRVLIYPSDWRLNPNTDGDADLDMTHIARVLGYAADEFSVILNPTDTLRRDSGQTMWRQPYSKFLAFNLTQYDRVIVLGTESIILNAMDELFFLAPTPIAMPYVFWGEPGGWRFSNQIMVIQSSSTHFSKIENKIKNADSDVTDLDIVYKLYGDRITRLPQRPYHILSTEFRLKEKEHSRYLGNPKVKWNPAQILRETKLVHFFDPPIPERWIASSSIWKKYTPRCAGSSNRKYTCGNRDAWVSFYSNYEYRRKNICGTGYEPQ